MATITAVKLLPINGRMDPWITVRWSPEEIPQITENKFTWGRGEFHWGLNRELGLYRFGYLTNALNERPGQGSYWSSRASVFGPVIGEELIECAVNSGSYAITKNKLQELLDEYGFSKEYEIRQEKVVPFSNDTEMAWYVMKK